MTLVKVSKSTPQTCCAISVRLSTRRGLRMKNSSSAYSRGLSSIGWPARVTVRVAGSRLRSATVERRRPGGRAAPQQGADARQQLGEFERLGEIVVGTEVEAGDLVGHSGARGQQQNRHGVAARAQLAHDVQAIAPRQHHVEDHHVVARRQGLAQAGHAVVRDVDLVVLGFEPAADEAGDLLLILDDQDAHPSPVFMIDLPGKRGADADPTGAFHDPCSFSREGTTVCLLHNIAWERNTVGWHALSETSRGGRDCRNGGTCAPGAPSSSGHCRACAAV